MNYDEIVNALKEHYPTEEIKIKAFCRCVTDVFGEDLSPYDVGNMHKVYQLFTTDRGVISHSTYYRIKRYVKCLYQILFDNGLTSEAMLQRVQNISASDVLENTSIIDRFFANYESIINYIDRAAEKFDCDPENCLHDLKCIVTLAWLGVSMGDMCQVKMSDVSDDYVVVNGESIKLSPDQAATFRKAVAAESYLSFPGHRKTSYMPSIYLLRSGRLSQYSIYSIDGILARFNNNVSGTTGKRLRVESLSVNGILYRAFEIEMSTGMKPEQAIKIASGRYDTNLYTLNQLYTSWKNYYAGEIERRTTCHL